MTRILWFHPRPLLPARSGGELRTLGLVRAAISAGHDVLIVQPGQAGIGSDETFGHIGLDLYQGSARAVAKLGSRHPLRSARPMRTALRAARSEIDAYGAEVGIVSDVMSWSIAADLMPAIPWIYDAHNVEMDLFDAMQKDAAKAHERITFGIDRRRVRNIEFEMLDLARAIAAVSSQDAETFMCLAPERQVVVVPSSVDWPQSAVDLRCTGPNVLFVGTLDYPPNVDALNTMIQRIMPAIRDRVANSMLLVAGRHPTRELRDQFERHNWIDFWEDTPDIQAAYRASRCTVLPMNFGGGSRLKVYEALAMGLPVIGTAAALSGIDLGENLIVRSYEIEDLATKAAQVLLDPAEASRLGAAGRSLFARSLSWDTASAPMLGLIEEITASG